MKKFILFVLIGVLLYIFFVYNSIEDEINENIAIDSWFMDGYKCAYDTYTNGDPFRSTIPKDYNKLLTKFKLVYDSGYGFGWADAKNGTTENINYASTYNELGPDWMYRLYYFFN